tara:strand:- start:1228 stop:1401 length:174 start_codon:yes stop_codon:yes gene_type:complete
MEFLIMFAKYSLLALDSLGTAFGFALFVVGQSPNVAWILWIAGLFSLIAINVAGFTY